MYELSYDSHEDLKRYAEAYTDDERFDCNDPFELIAAKEEELECPIYFA